MELNNTTHLTDLTLRHGDAIVVIDLQHDFLPGGALAAQAGDRIIPGVNQLLAKARQERLPAVFTQDWHPSDHYSFASMHEGKEPFDPYEGTTGRSIVTLASLKMITKPRPGWMAI